VVSNKENLANAQNAVTVTVHRPREIGVFRDRYAREVQPIVLERLHTPITEVKLNGITNLAKGRVYYS